MKNLKNLINILEQINSSSDERSTKDLGEICTVIAAYNNCTGIQCRACPFDTKSTLEDTLKEAKKLGFLNLL